jgi:hypothetical protein
MVDPELNVGSAARRVDAVVECSSIARAEAQTYCVVVAPAVGYSICNTGKLWIDVNQPAQC